MKDSPVYEFGPFRLDKANRCLFRDGELVPLQPKTYEVLLMLIENRDGLVTRDELMTSIWGADVSVEEGALGYQIRQVRSVLGDVPSAPQYIKTIPKLGFRFIASVNLTTRAGTRLPNPDKSTEGPGPGNLKQEDGLKDASSLDYAENPPNMSAELESVFGGHIGHVVVSCSFYGALYAVMLLLEIAYRFETYGSTGLKLAPLVFAWIFSTSAIALAVDWRQVVKGRSDGLALSVLVFLAAAGLLFAGICLFLPESSITESGTASYPAQASYLKDICYSQPLMLMFLAPTFHFVVAMQRELRLGRHRQALELLTGGRFSVSPRGTIYPRFWMLALALMIMAAISAFLTTNLLDHLEPSPYKNLFINLIYIRLVLHFGLALKCLSWYHRALDALKRECITGIGSAGKRNEEESALTSLSLDPRDR